MRLLVCGGRDFADFDFMNEVLTWFSGSNDVEVIIHGAQRGADSLAAEWAKLANIPDLPFKVSREEWRLLGKSAGPIRNRRMIYEGKPDFVIAFPGGSGTADMVAAARANGIVAMEAEKVLEQ